MSDGDRVREREVWNPGERFTIRGKLGSGAMGEAYKAYEKSLRRMVALKRPSDAVRAEKDLWKRFEDEGSALALLDHKNIIRVYQIASDPDGEPFLVTEFVDGMTLTKLLQRKDQMPSAKQRYYWLVYLADAIAAAHERGVLHRDIKPGNIVVNGKGVLKLLDFGLAVETQTQIEKGRTSEGFPAGTPGYLAPERLKGHKATPQSDQYSFGVVAYQLCTGIDPIGMLPGDAAGQAIQRLRESLHEYSAIPYHLLLVIHRCLSESPLERYESTADLGRAIREAVNPDVLSVVGTPRATGVRLIDEADAAEALLAELARSFLAVTDAGKTQSIELYLWGYSLHWIDRLPSAITAAAKDRPGRFRRIEVSVMVPTIEALNWFDDRKKKGNRDRLETNVGDFEKLATERTVRRVTIYRSNTIPDSLGLLLDSHFGLTASYHFDRKKTDTPFIKDSNALKRKILECVIGADEGRFVIDGLKRRWWCRAKECRILGNVRVSEPPRRKKP